jgi:hypothetical protein
MAKGYSEISVKAATITGGIIGFIWSLLAALFTVGMMGAYSYGMMQGYWAGGIVFVVFATIFFAIAFGFVALVYNYALRNWGK